MEMALTVTAKTSHWSAVSGKDDFERALRREFSTRVRDDPLRGRFTGKNQRGSDI